MTAENSLKFYTLFLRNFLSTKNLPISPKNLLENVNWIPENFSNGEPRLFRLHDDWECSIRIGGWKKPPRSTLGVYVSV